MRLIAQGLLLIVFLSIVIEPLVEVANVLKEKIVIGSAISNACRAAKDRSLILDDIRNLDAAVDQDAFKNYFVDAFEEALSVTNTSVVGNTLTFRSDIGDYNEFIVTLDFVDRVDLSTGRTVTEVQVEARTEYKFRTAYLRLADNASGGIGYELVSERIYLLEIRN